MQTRSLVVRFGDLIACGVLAVLAVLLVAVDADNPVRLIMGALLATCLPGYPLSSILWGPRSRLSLSDRLLFSVGLSVSILVLAELALPATGVGIFPTPVALLLGDFAFAFSAIAIATRVRQGLGVPKEVLVALRSLWAAIRASPAFSAGVAIILAILLVVVLLVVTTPVPQPATQFYVLGSDDTPSTLPRSLPRNESATLIVGIYNGQDSGAIFTVTVCLALSNATCSGIAAPAAWNSNLSLTPGATYDLIASVQGRAAAENRFTFRIPVDGMFTLSLVLVGGGPMAEVHLPLSVL